MPLWNGHSPAWGLLSEKTFIFIPNFVNSLDDKEKVGSPRKETWPALPGYPFLIVGSNSKQGFLGWNHLSIYKLCFSDASACRIHVYIFLHFHGKQCEEFTWKTLGWPGYTGNTPLAGLLFIDTKDTLLAVVYWIRLNHVSEMF